MTTTNETDMPALSGLGELAHAAIERPGCREALAVLLMTSPDSREAAGALDVLYGAVWRFGTPVTATFDALDELEHAALAVGWPAHPQRRQPDLFPGADLGPVARGALEKPECQDALHAVLLTEPRTPASCDALDALYDAIVQADSVVKSVQGVAGYELVQAALDARWSAHEARWRR